MTYYISAIVREQELVLTNEGFRQDSYTHREFDTLEEAKAEFDSIDLEYLKADGFNAVSVPVYISDSDTLDTVEVKDIDFD